MTPEHPSHPPPVPVIEDLDKLVQTYTGPDKNLINLKVDRLTAPGENYLGIVLKVDGTLKDIKTGKEEPFNAVAKCLNFKMPGPMKDMVPKQYEKELAFYTEVVPTLKKFVEESGLEEKYDFFPLLYAARRNLRDDKESDIDENAVLLMENLGLQGYQNKDRTVGFDLVSTKLILKDIALFHAAPIAMKLKKPQLFEENIKKHLARPVWNIDKEKDMKENPMAKAGKMWVEILSENPDTKQYCEKIQIMFDTMHEKFMEAQKKIPNEPFATIYHNDLWTNNTMQILKDGTAMKSKLLDFQFYSYDSPALDLVFFLWSSVELPVILEHFDSLMDYYQTNFLNYLDRFGCDIEPFAGDNFQKEVEEHAPSQLEHVMFMCIAIYGKKGEAAFDMEKGPAGMEKGAITETAKNRVIKIVAEFGKRGWIP